MPELFTTYESVQPPEIVTPDVKQNYQEIQALSIPDNLSEKNDTTDWSFLNQKQEDLDPIKFETTTVQNNSNKNNSTVQRVIDVARSFVGSKYRWGGTSPSTGFDCSGLMQYAYKAAGINLPRTAAQQGKVGQEIGIQNAAPGDMIWFGSKNSPSGQHIGLVSKVENGQIYIIDAAGKKLGVTERALPNLQIKSVRRILGGTPTSDSFASTVLNFFMNKGLSENQSRGILGNLMQESRGNHRAINKTSGATGIAQWLGARKQRLQQRYGNNSSLEQQLNFIWEELNTTEKGAFQKLLNTNTVADATRAFAQHFERAGKNEMNMNKRINFAYQA